jgi:NADPH-dependent 2,4-dienoyl-CoA reductase/sulfur reductase-like enzyme
VAGTRSRIVVVGGGLAAVRTVSSLRRRGFGGRVVVLAEESQPPYDRPPLSKAVLAGEREDTTLRFDTASLDVDLRLGTPAVGLDLSRRVVATPHGEVGFDGLAIASGAFPVRLPGPGSQVTLRTAADAIALRERLRPGARVVVIGASWIGAEVATQAIARGCVVTCLEAGAAPLAGAVGAEVGSSFLPWWAGIDLRLNVAVDSIEHEAVVLTDGTAVPADVVVTGVGVRPEVSWLAGSGVDIERGVAVDAHLRVAVAGATVPDVVAVGDVAARWSPRAGRRLLVGHWEDASGAGAVAAETLLAAPEDARPVHDPVSYFWSDQFGHKIQYVGAHGPADRPFETPDERPGRTLTWIGPTGSITAVLTVDRPRDCAAARGALAQGAAHLELPLSALPIDERI